MELSQPPADAPLILVADDVPANVELLFDQLHVLGFRADRGVRRPRGASRPASSSIPTSASSTSRCPLVISGVDDRSTGFEVCRRIKRDPRTARIPVIFVTALNDTTDRVKAIEAGGDDFLTKPHNRLVLGARVRSLLKLKAATDALEESLRKQKELEKVRDDLMKMIVHDLKSPLTSVHRRDGDARSTATSARSRDNSGARSATPRDARRICSSLIEDLLEVRAARGDAARAASRGDRARRRCSPRSPASGRSACSRSARRHVSKSSDDAPVGRCRPGAHQARVQQPDSERAHALGARRHRHARRARAKATARCSPSRTMASASRPSTTTSSSASSSR